MERGAGPTPAGAADLELPRRLVESMAREDDADRRGWVERLPSTIAALADRWDLGLGAVMQPGGQCSWVCEARLLDGDDAVLKVGWLHDEARHEADALRFWAGDGAVILHDAVRMDDTSALLLERCRPGDPLDRRPGEEQDEVIADVLRRLWKTPSPGHPFRSLASMCAWWADEAETNAERRGCDLTPTVLAEGLALFRSLPLDTTDDVVLCTDLHAENILSSTRQPWLAIDPKPYVGDRHYDVLQHLLNAPDRLAVDPAGWVRRMAALADLDPARLRLWAFARLCQEAPGAPHLASAAAALAP